MDLIKDIPLVRWVARLFLLAIIVAGLWWFLKGTKKFDYVGLQKYQPTGTLLNKVVKQFGPQFEKKKKKRVNKTEEICRKIIQKIYNRPFPSVRPDFLKSPVSKKNLELDCYNSDLRIALEYNGQQHYTYTPYFHKFKKNFYSQVHRDDWKRQKCRDLGIKLIEVPYWVIPIDLEEYITKELKKKGCL